VAKRKLPDALRENADRLKRGEALHQPKKGPKRPPQKPKIRTRKTP
jgi:hypothetical protein